MLARGSSADILAVWGLLLGWLSVDEAVGSIRSKYVPTKVMLRKLNMRRIRNKGRDKSLRTNYVRVPEKTKELRKKRRK
jgi:hypothetical protein